MTIKPKVPDGDLVSPSPLLEKSSQLLFENLKWLTSDEAVVYLRLPSVSALRALVHRRRIPFAKLGRSLRFNKEQLDEFLVASTFNRRALR